MKPKTLKDLWGVVKDTDMHDWVSVQVLKAEAIRRARICKKYKYIDRFLFIVEFFNLTEDDLK